MFLDPMLKAGEVVEVKILQASKPESHPTVFIIKFKVSTFKPIEQNVLSKDKYTGKKSIMCVRNQLCVYEINYTAFI